MDAENGKGIVKLCDCGQPASFRFCQDYECARCRAARRLLEDQRRREMHREKREWDEHCRLSGLALARESVFCL